MPKGNNKVEVRSKGAEEIFEEMLTKQFPKWKNPYTGDQYGVIMMHLESIINIIVISIILKKKNFTKLKNTI